VRGTARSQRRRRTAGSSVHRTRFRNNVVAENRDIRLFDNGNNVRTRRLPLILPRQTPPRLYTPLFLLFIEAERSAAASAAATAQTASYSQRP